MKKTAGRIVLDISTSLGFHFSPPNKYTRVERALLKELEPGKDATIACCSRGPTFVLADEAHAQGPAHTRRIGKFDGWLQRFAFLGGDHPVRWRPFDRSLAAAMPFTFEAGDLVLLAGASWNHLDLATLLRLKQKTGFTLAGFVYDLLPIQYPSFISAEGREQYRDFLLRLAEAVDLVVTPSDAVAADFQNFLHQHEMKMPRIATISLAAAALPAEKGAASRRLKGARLHQKSFALCVAPLRKREHLLWLYSLWSEIWQKEERPPVLVCAGTVLEPDLLELLRNDPLWGKAGIFYANPSDTELHWLYSHSLFCLHPSFEGGLGLPLREAINHGKLYISADAIPPFEGHEGRSIHLPQDRDAWLAAIRKLIPVASADCCGVRDPDTPASILGQILGQLSLPARDISKMRGPEIESRQDFRDAADASGAAAPAPHVRRRR